MKRAKLKLSGPYIRYTRRFNEWEYFRGTSFVAYQSSVKRARRDIVRAQVSCDARPRNRSNDPISFLVAHTDSTNDSTTYGSMSNAFTRPSASAHCICVRACARRRTRKSRLSLFSRMGAKINFS